MSARFVGRSVPRVNDETMLRGAARYVADLAGTLRGVLYAAVIRSRVAHGILEGLEVDGLPDDARLVGPEDLRRRATGRLPVLWHIATQNQTSTPLLDGKVRYAGQPVGVVVAPSAAAAVDAAEAVLPVIDELPAVTDPLDALTAGAPRLWDDVEGNLLGACAAGDSDEHVEAVFAAAATASAAFMVRRSVFISGPPVGDSCEAGTALRRKFRPRGHSWPWEIPGGRVAVLAGFGGRHSRNVPNWQACLQEWQGCWWPRTAPPPTPPAPCPVRPPASPRSSYSLTTSSSRILNILTMLGPQAAQGLDLLLAVHLSQQASGIVARPVENLEVLPVR